MNKILIGVIGVAALAALVLGATNYQAIQAFPQQVSNALGASGTGPNHYQAENFLQGLFGGTNGQYRVTNAGHVVEGGNPIAITGTGSNGAASTTLTAAQVCNAELITVSGSNNTTTLTMPSTASVKAACISSVPSELHFRIFNNSTNTIQIVAGANMNALNVSSSANFPPTSFESVVYIQKTSGSSTLLTSQYQ